MLTNSPPSDVSVPQWHDGAFPRLPDDAEFDRVFPAQVRQSSATHWTPVEVCLHAAEWLVAEPGTRVLDVGCGPGKFCALGAATTPGRFSGVEQRKQLCRAARTMLRHFRFRRVQILHANVTEVAFNCFDAFYIFNPFQENLVPQLRIDAEVQVEFAYYARYINYVRRELSQLPQGTRVVTYWGDCDEIPPCYDCEETAFNGTLRLWVKQRGLAIELSTLEAMAVFADGQTETPVI